MQLLDRPLVPRHEAPGRRHPSGQRVGYVLKMYPRFSETFIVNEILAHEAAGLDVHIFSLRPAADGRFHTALADVRAGVTYIENKGLKTAELWRRLGEVARRFGGLGASLDDLLAADVGDAAQALQVAEAVEHEGITHLHAHFGSVATTVARLVSLTTGVPYTFTAHAKDIFHDDVDAGDLREKLADAAACVTVSDFNVGHLEEVRGDGRGRIQRIYNGLHLDRFPYSDPTDRPPTVIAVGRLVEKKGFADLVVAIGMLRDAGRDVRCLIVGTGPLEETLRGQVSDTGLDSAVTLTGALPQHRVVEIVRSSAVMVAPCVVGADGNRDGMPTVLLESMAIGTPCVATPVTGVPELIQHGRTGLLVDEHDPAGLADAIGELLDDATRRAELATEARRTIEAEFDVVRQSRRLREVFALAAVGPAGGER